MTLSRERMIGPRRLARAASIGLLAVAVILSGLLPSTGRAAAQERPRSIMEMLFGGPSVRQRERVEPPPRRVIRRAPETRRRKPASTRRSSTPREKTRAAAPAVAPSAPVDKLETARTILVVGDFLGATLAAGLEDRLADRPDLKVVNASNGSSGLVRDDHYDWPGNIQPLVDDEKPALVVVMLGSNDRQPITIGSQTLMVRSAEWTAEYERRAAALAAAIGEKKVPLLWVGMPAFRLSNMTADMAFLNEIYRKAAASVGGEFVDIWDGFVDADGAFITTGPDIAGQQVRLRNQDGITMTDAGRDKLAFFAENPILRLLGAGDTVAATAETPSRSAPVANPATATSAPLLALTDPALNGGETLLGGAATSRPTPVASPRDKLVTSGLPGVKTPGRADAFAWNPKSPSVTPLKTGDAVIFRGSVDLNSVIEPKPLVPPRPMPSLADAIIEEWTTSVGAEAPTKPDALGEATAAPSGASAQPDLGPRRR